jgi:hypothetical protein
VVYRSGIRDRSRAGDLLAEGIELVGVANRARRAGCEPNISVAVVAVESWRPGAAGELVLADPLPTVGVGFRHGAVDHLVEHLGVAGGIQRVYPGTS